MKLSIATLFFIVADVATGRQLLDDDCTLYAIGDTRLQTRLRNSHRIRKHSSKLDFVCEPNGLGAQGNLGAQGSIHINLTKAQRKFLQNGMNSGSVVSGLTTLQGAYYEGDEIVISENTTFGRKEEQLKILSNKKKSILVVRVTDKDGKVIGDSAAQVGDNVFGTLNDPVNLKSQMFDCSYGAVDITNVYTSPNIDDKLSALGVLDVTIPISINGDRYTVHNAVTTAANAKLGYNLPGQHEQVMYVLEKCYQDCNWAAYAYINSWLSVYQDRYYLQTGVQMHEIGHNLGMAHSGGLNGQAYTDHTCLMGNPLYSDDVGKMCFNPAKNWYLNWYDEYKTTVDIRVPNILKQITMVGIAEIKDNNPNKKPAVLKLETGTSNDYFVGFNRAIGKNSQNVEADNEVTIVQTGNNGESYSQSYLKATLKQGESYSIGDLRIIATAINIATRPGTAIVTLDNRKGFHGTYFIRSAHGTQIRIYPYNKVDMTVNKLSWERITIVPLGNDQYALKSAAHRRSRYLRVPGGGRYRTINTQTYVGAWEKFYITRLSNGQVIFKSVQWKNYLRASRGNNRPLNTQTYVGGWERFTLVSA